MAEELKYYMFQSHNFCYRKKMLGLDYDHTIVKPKSKSTFSKNIDDWTWLRPKVPDIIRHYYEKKYAIVIFTNQSHAFKKTQIKNVMDSLGIPYRVYMMMNKEYKKPNPISFNHYKKENFDFENSMYVGDALGRPHDWSDSDLLFALNCGLNPKEPEDIFPFEERKSVTLKPHNKQETVLLVGYPASGKTTISQQFKAFENYVVLHGDELKTEAKIKKSLKTVLESGKSAVIDATNPSIAKRKEYIDIAKKYDTYIRVIHVNTSIEQSMERNSTRTQPVPKIVFYVYRKKFEMPSIEEGINNIITI